MKLIAHENKLYMIASPVIPLFNSSLIREVCTRGDFFAIDLTDGTMTILPGAIRTDRRNLRRIGYHKAETLFDSYVRDCKKRILETSGDIAIIESANKDLAHSLALEQSNVDNALNALTILKDDIAGRVKAVAMLCEAAVDLPCAAIARQGDHAYMAINEQTAQIRAIAANVKYANPNARGKAVDLLRKMDEDYQTDMQRNLDKINSGKPADHNVVSEDSPVEADDTKAAPVPPRKRAKKPAESLTASQIGLMNGRVSVSAGQKPVRKPRAKKAVPVRTVND